MTILVLSDRAMEYITVGGTDSVWWRTTWCPVLYCEVWWQGHSFVGCMFVVLRHSYPLCSIDLKAHCTTSGPIPFHNWSKMTSMYFSNNPMKYHQKYISVCIQLLLRCRPMADFIGPGGNNCESDILMKAVAAWGPWGFIAYNIL